MTKEAKQAPAPTEIATLKTEKIVQNGVPRPFDGGLTGAVWDIADKLSAHLQRPPTKQEVFDECAAQGCKKGTTATQFSLWKRFNGLTRKAKEVTSTPDVATETEANEDMPEIAPT